MNQALRTAGFTNCRTLSRSRSGPRVVSKMRIRTGHSYPYQVSRLRSKTWWITISNVWSNVGLDRFLSLRKSLGDCYESSFVTYRTSKQQASI